MLIIGLVAGAGISSMIWALIRSAKNKKLAKEEEEKGDVVSSVTKLFAEADAVEANFREGKLTPENFRRALSDKSGAVKRVLRTNMDILDVFFVKYAEQQANDYLRVIDNPERRKTEADHALPSAKPADTADFPEETLMDGIKKLPAAPVAAPPVVPPVPPVAVRSLPVNDVFDPSTVPAVPAPEAVVKIPVFTAAKPDEFVPPVKAPVSESAKPVIEPVVKPAVEPVVKPVTEPAIKPAAVAEGDAWSEPSIEEFEAAFAQFEEQVAPQSEIPPQPAPRPVATPPEIPPPPAPQQAVPPPLAPPAAAGITGDDVASTIDNMFNLK
ncbi:MAG: hypothetical protein LBC70_07085 [Chitinispirillales bacterium]|nr:hypothetical protein [Chitinispirillales bacterium]